jgi:hypothetical protein
MNVTAHINVSTPKGRKIVEELKRHKKIVEIENPMPVGIDGLPEETYSAEFIEEYLWNKLDEHYETDIRKS